MPLFDVNNAASAEAPALFHLADILSECEQFRELSEKTTIADARDLITIGPAPDPIDGEEYTEDELNNDFFYCSVAPSDDEGHEAIQPETLTECPLEGGSVEAYIRRQVRKSEVGQAGGKADVYLYFLDRVSAIVHQIFEQASDETRLRVLSVRREFSPSFGDIASAVAQGEYIWTNLVVEWGELDRGGNS